MATYRINTMLGGIEQQLNDPSNLISQTWKQVFVGCEMVIRFSTRRGRFLLEIMSQEEHPGALKASNENMAANLSHGFIPQVTKKQRMTFDLVYKLGGYSSNSSKRLKTNKQLGQQVAGA